MATYYVGSGGNDGNTGLSWAQRFLTLNGAEDEPVAASDTVYVAPGVYRELLTMDVSGGAGTPITYIGDVSGENTDGVGGIVRVTGSDDDQSDNRAHGFYGGGAARHYRTFRGFSLDTHTAYNIRTDNSTDIIVEDCTFQSGQSGSIMFFGTQSDMRVSRCLFTASKGIAITFQSAGGVDDTASVIENCLCVVGYTSACVFSLRIGGITVTNCSFICSYTGVVANTLTAGQTVSVYNCLLEGNRAGFSASALGFLVEDYNSLHHVHVARTNVNVGGNSVTYPALVNFPTLLDGYRSAWWFGELSEWSQLGRLAGTSMDADDLRGITRPVTDSKKSWGAVQLGGEERDTSTTYDASTASLTLPDAGRVQFKIPTADATEITISVRAYREANYAGTNPRLIVKQPGQADDTTTDAAAASQWNELTTTLTPADEPDYVIVELVSLNTAAAGNYATFFDALSVDSSPTLGDLDNWITDRIPFSDVQAAGSAGGMLQANKRGNKQ